MKIIWNNPEHPLHNSVVQLEYLPSWASSDPPQRRLLQDILPAAVTTHDSLRKLRMTVKETHNFHLVLMKCY